MKRQIRIVASLAVLVAAGLATVATEPSQTTRAGATVERSLNLTTAAPTLVEHATATMTGGDHPETVQAVIYLDWTQAGAKPVEVSVVRDEDGSVVTLGPNDSQGGFGASFAPFVSCNATGPCEATFTVTLRLVSNDPVSTQWGFGLTQAVDPAIPSGGTKLAVTLSP